MKRQTHLDRKCKRCKLGTILDKYNAKSSDGTIICAECKLEEIYANVKIQDSTE